MSETDKFFQWYFVNGLGSLGGWFIFFFIAVCAAIWLFYDSSNRKIQANGWRLAIVLLLCLMIPTNIWRFSGNIGRVSLDPFLEAIFYLGLLGGILPPILAAGYYVTYRGTSSYSGGDNYLGNDYVPTILPDSRAQDNYGGRGGYRNEAPVAPQPEKRKVAAWLVGGGRNYQLCQGKTTIGKSMDNDISLEGDRTICRHHASITEQNGHYRLMDLGSTNGTKVNGKRLHNEAIIIEADDEIQFGDNTVLRFKA